MLLLEFIHLENKNEAVKSGCFLIYLASVVH